MAAVNKLWPFMVLLALALIGCQVNEAARADAPGFNLNEPFTLSGGQEGLIAGENLRLRFDQVLEDSRCPTRVSCVWTGQARITVTVRPDGNGATTVEFNTNPAPGRTVSTAHVGPYGIELQSLEPYPQSPEDPIPFGDYRATLVVRKT